MSRHAGSWWRRLRCALGMHAPSQRVEKSRRFVEYHCVACWRLVRLHDRWLHASYRNYGQWAEDVYRD